MQIHSLENTTIDQIAECFNKAFEAYFVPMKMDAQLLRDKIKSENILLEHSIGVTINNLLAGFILTGIDTKNNIAYNAGTGVIPEYRGQKLTEKMYPYLLDNLSKIGIQSHYLEVICENKKALKIYQNLGYSIIRKVICYKGQISGKQDLNYQIEVIELPGESKVNSFWNHNPTYQNSTDCIGNNPEKHSALGVFDNETLIGYLIFDKNTLRVKQFGVDKSFRNNGIGYHLFSALKLLNPEAVIVIINVDENDFETNKFLEKIGLKAFIEQYEMKSYSFC